MRLHMDVYKYVIADALFMALKYKDKTKDNNSSGGWWAGAFQGRLYFHVTLMVLRGGFIMTIMAIIGLLVWQIE